MKKSLLLMISFACVAFGQPVRPQGPDGRQAWRIYLEEFEASIPVIAALFIIYTNFTPSTQASRNASPGTPTKLSPGLLIPSLSRWSGRTGTQCTPCALIRYVMRLIMPSLSKKPLPGMQRQLHD